MTVGIVGLGLIGGSIGLALRQPTRTILGYDPSSKACETALSRQCVDATATLAEVCQADVLFVAPPPDVAVDTLRSVAAERAQGTVVTDCVSVKAPVVEWAMEERPSWFVPGHPMAGHEKRGAAFASAWLFRGARWILCPVSFTDKSAVRAVEEAVKAMGAQPARMDAQTHDRQVAVLSHLPHVLASALVQMGEEMQADVGGGSWRDLTRVAGADADLWTQILLGNRVQVSAAIADTQSKLEEVRRLLDSGDREALSSLLRKSMQAKQRDERPAPPAARTPRRKRT
jgi:prephenate dehydrogenase